MAERTGQESDEAAGGFEDRLIDLSDSLREIRRHIEALATITEELAALL